MRYAFTATRKLTQERRRYIRLICETTLAPEATEFTTGAAKGGDTYLAGILRAMYPDAHHRLCVPNGDKYNRSLVESWPGERRRLRVGAMRGESNDLLARNQLLLDYADELIAFPLRRESAQPRSGTWATIRRARDRGIEVSVFPLWVH